MNPSQGFILTGIFLLLGLQGLVLVRDYHLAVRELRLGRRGLESLEWLEIA